MRTPPELLRTHPDLRDVEKQLEAYLRQQVIADSLPKPSPLRLRDRVLGVSLIIFLLGTPTLLILAAVLLAKRIVG